MDSFTSSSRPFRARLLSSGLALVAACALAVASAPAAQAAPRLLGATELKLFNRVTTSSQNNIDIPAPAGGARVVTFGDSHTGGAKAPMTADERGCLHSSDGWPNQLRNLNPGLGQYIVDVSCHGSAFTQGISFADQVRYAESLGALGPNTTDIIVQLGMNDDWSSIGSNMMDFLYVCYTQGKCGQRAIDRKQITNPDDVTVDNYISRVKPVTDYLKYYYPNARIHLMNYIPLAPKPQQDFCLRVVGVPVAPIPFSAPATRMMERITVAGKQAAARLDLGYIDLAAASRGHDMCASDAWLDGILDPANQFLGTNPFHPTVTGNWVAANIVNQAITKPTIPAPPAAQ